MNAHDPRWLTKINALLCRWPGQTAIIESEIVRQADRVAFALNVPSSSGEFKETLAEASVLHPLTGKSHELKGLTEAQWAAAADYVQERAQTLRGKYPDNPKRQFLALWRLLSVPPKSGEVSDLDEAARRWWQLFPADPQAPSALLWEHQSLVSALVGTEADGTLRPALLQFNIADTQPFVTRARRTQDLWAGSYLLSFLCWQLLEHFADTYGPDCVLQPLLRGQPLADLWLRDVADLGNVVPLPGADQLLISNIPNIFTVLLPEDQVETAVSDACAKMLAKWGEISEAVRATFEKAARCGSAGWDAECDAIWKRQQDGFLKDNMFWAAVPLPTGQLTSESLEEWKERNDPFLAQTERDIYAPIREAMAANPNAATGGLLYGLCSQLTARLLSDRKRTRDFGQVYEPGQKCSLTGALQAVYPTPLTPGGDLAAARNWWQSLAQFDGERMTGGRRFKMAGRIRRGDRLCAIQAVKRLMLQAYFEESHDGEPKLDRHQFPSTAGIANAHFVANVLEYAAQDASLYRAVVTYVRSVRGLLGRYYYESAQLPAWNKAHNGPLRRFCQLDAECLYEEFYEEAGLRREFGDGIAARSDFTERLKAAKVARNGLMKALDGRAGSPSRYYAIIALDGDSMGDWISGKKSGVTPGPALHLALTGALSGFALEDVQRIVEITHAGKLVYAGGDDVLALVPVADLLPVLDALYRAYRGLEPGLEDMKGFVERDGVLELRMGCATLSAGAVIVHEATPLSHAVEEARAAEHDAKERHGRDAFAIRLLKRSGAPVEIGGKWRAGGEDVPQAALAAERLMRDGKLSSKIAYTMQEDHLEQRKVNGTEVWPAEALAQARRAEFWRIAGRHLTASPEERADAMQKLAPLVQLVGLADPAGARGANQMIGWEDGWVGVQGLLRLARMIAEEA